MSILTTPPQTRASRADQARERTPHYRVTFLGVIRSEWIKTVGLRSTWWTLGVTTVVIVGFAALISGSLALMGDSEGVPVAGFRLDAVTVGLSFAQLAVAVLGALLITGEFTTGSVRSTFSAVPGRTAVILGKGMILIVLVAITGLVSTALAFAVGIPAFSGTGYSFDASDTATWRVLLGTSLYLVTLALFSLGVGAIMRNSTGTIFALVAILFVLPMITSIAGSFKATEWIGTAGEYLPSNAGNQLLATTTLPGDLTPWQGYGVLAVWTVVALIVGIVLTKKRDA